MNIPEVDLTKMISNQPEQNINLLENISEEQVKAKEFLSNYSSDSYKKYVAMLENYFNEKKSKKYNQKYRYYVDEESKFVKEAIDKADEKNNIIINVPKYINIDLKLSQLSKMISTNETKLRFIRSSLLNGNTSQSAEFDKIKSELLSQMKDKNILIEVKKQRDNNMMDEVNISKEEIDEILNKKIQQNSNFTSISEFIEDKKFNDDLKFLIRNYVENNLEILKYQEKIRMLKEKMPEDHIVEEVPVNDKKKIKFKPKSQKKSKKVAGKAIEDAVPESVQIPKLESYKDFEINDESQEKIQMTNIVESEDKTKLENTGNTGNTGITGNTEIDLLENLENKEVNLVNNIQGSQIEPAQSVDINDAFKIDDNELNEVDIFGKFDNSLNSKNDNEINLLPGEELEIMPLPELSDELEELVDHDFEDENNYNVTFNSPESIKEKTRELSFDKNLPLFNNSQNSQNSQNSPNNQEEENSNGESTLDINKLSRDLNKKVPDNVKIVKIKMNPEDSNIQFDKIKGKSRK